MRRCLQLLAGTALASNNRIDLGKRRSMKLATLAPKGRWTIRRQTADDCHPGASNARCAAALSRHIGSHPASLRPYSGFFKPSRTPRGDSLFSRDGAGLPQDAAQCGKHGLSALPKFNLRISLPASRLAHARGLG